MASPSSGPRRLLWLAFGSLLALSVLSMTLLSPPPSELHASRTLRDSLPPSAAVGQPPPTPTPMTQSEETPTRAPSSVQRRRARVAAVASSVARLSQQTTQPRGVVLPLFDGIAPLGISLLFELREMGVDLPVEVPHCGDLDERLAAKLAEFDPSVRVYDVCLEASTYTLERRADRKLFCDSVDECHYRFRGFEIKILALLFSRFDELMMLDADTLFFQSPLVAWHSNKYQQTGTLFFHDRISCDQQYLALPRKRGQNQTISELQEFLARFDPEPFRDYSVVPRPKANSSLGPWEGDQAPVSLAFEPSDWLLASHSWNRRAGHQADSSFMLWNKKKQQRATVILGTFITRGGIGQPPSYGDKEFYFIACELAESQYAFSDFGVGSIGTDVHNPDDRGNSVLCGDALHYVPDDTGGSDPPTLYINSDRILEFQPTDQIYRSLARPASLYPGKFEERNLAQECPFDLTVEKLTDRQMQVIARRQKFYQKALLWKPPTEAPATQPPPAEPPQTEAPATEAPKTEAPPVNEFPLTVAPTDDAPLTVAPVAKAPSVEAPPTSHPDV